MIDNIPRIMKKIEVNLTESLSSASVGLLTVLLTIFSCISISSEIPKAIKDPGI